MVCSFSADPICWDLLVGSIFWIDWIFYPSKLYSALHELDQLELDVIIAEKVPNIGLGKSINDRLKRASS